jgi:hypothetical protein
MDLIPESSEELQNATRVREDHAAIQAGIDAMHAGNVLSLDELDRRIRSRLAAAASPKR